MYIDPYISLMSYFTSKPLLNSNDMTLNQLNINCSFNYCSVYFKEYTTNVYMCAQSCLTLWDTMDHRLPGSSVDDILQARILEWWKRSPAQVGCMRQVLGPGALGKDPEGWGREGGGRGDRDGEFMLIHGWFMSVYDKTHYNIVK